MLIILSALVAFPAWAQEIPSSTRPDVVGQEFREPETPLSTEDFTLPSPGVGTMPPGVEDVRFVLKEIVLEGNRALSTAELRPIYADLLGNEISLSSVFEAASSITALYADAGYALVVAYIPAQEIIDGRVRISVIEGFVAEVHLTGDMEGRAPSGYMARRTRKIIDEKPLSTALLERQLLLLNDIPGLTVSGVLDRSETVGGTNLILDVERDRFDVSIGWDTRGSKALGPSRWQGAFAINDIFGLGARLSANIVRSAGNGDLKHYGTQLFTPLFWDLDLTAYASWTDSDPGIADLRLLEFASDGAAGGVGVRYPVVRSRNSNLTVNVNFDFQNSDSDFLSVANSEDKSRVLGFALSQMWLEADGSVGQVTVGVSKGISVFGATQNNDPLKSRFSSDFKFLKANASFFYLFPLNGYTHFVVRAKAQAGFDPTPVAEQCGYGGASFGRAFDGFEIAGDHCVAASVELQETLRFGDNDDSYVQLFGFTDAGKTWLRGPPTLGRDEESSALSVGGGMRISFLDHFNFSLEYAYPIGHDVALEGNRDGRFFVALLAQY